MKSILLLFSTMALLAASLLICMDACVRKDYQIQGASSTTYYAIEMKGSIAGYSEITETPVIYEGQRLMLQNGRIRFFLKLMGEDIETKVDIMAFVDSASMRPVRGEFKMEQAKVHLHYKSTYQEDKARLHDVMNDKVYTVPLTDSTLIENILYYPYLVRDFYGKKTHVRTYSFLNEKDARLDKREITFLGMDTIMLVGKSFVCMHFRDWNKDNGLIAETWVDPSTARMLKNDIPGINRITYLSDYLVKQMVTSLSMDEMLFYHVNQVIPEHEKLSFMKVTAEINTVGDVLDEASLNVAGQHFSGKVDDNVVSGVFEMSVIHYKGEGSPAFPFDYPVPKEDSARYLNPQDLIESDDPEIVQLATFLTRDDTTSWAAAVTLSRWVSENIGAALPGGGSAKGTLNMRQAECAGHSRLLTAMCRAVGIPARLAIGGAYVPDDGGFFGQHVWTEVYMGEAGWIPVDATFGEADYIDAGHIRLGERSSFHPVKVEIIEWIVE